MSIKMPSELGAYTSKRLVCLAVWLDLDVQSKLEFTVGVKLCMNLEVHSL